MRSNPRLSDRHSSKCESLPRVKVEVLAIRGYACLVAPPSLIDTKNQ
jgi:hypothetical protein